MFKEFWCFIRPSLKKLAAPNQDMTLTQDASKGGVPEQRLLKKTLVNGGGGTIYIYTHTSLLRSGVCGNQEHVAHPQPKEQH